MIPRNIERKHILQALEELSRTSWPEKRAATKFKLSFDGRYYPPKLVICTAAKYATGKIWPHSEFGGGVETNSFLTDRGFEVQKIASSEPAPTRNIADHKKTREQKSELPRARTHSSHTFHQKHYRICRITLKGDWLGEVPDAGAALDAVIEVLHGKVRVDYLVTPGGFLKFPWPDYVHAEDPSAGDDEAHQQLWEDADRSEVANLLTDDRLSRLSEITGALTLGVDSMVEYNTGQNQSAEYVLFIPLPTGNRHWTGKSYPTPFQKETLLRVTDLDSHFIEHNGDRIMILGCHDLNLFNARGRATAKGWKLQTTKDFERIAKQFKPNIVLQHPHTSDTPNIWRMGWNGLHQALPSVKHWAGTGKYFNPQGECRGELNDVLTSTASHEVLTITVDTDKPNKISQIIESSE